jgi:glycosyltransferase involved in cell wall biosynthesis
MNIGIYSPYLDTLGGGERYCLSLASYWSKIHNVDIFWGDPALIPAARARFDIDLSRVRLVPNAFRRRSFWSRLLATKRLDVLFALTDGSLPLSFARRNILHLQVPFARVAAPDWKLAMYQAVVCNSRFTQEHIDPRLVKKSIVIYPPVPPIAGGKKEKIILAVGRFSGHYQAKKQDVLIRAFRQACAKGKFSGWKLVLTGGLLPPDRVYFDSLKRKAAGAAIELLPNPDHATLNSLIAKSAIFWHAAGFGETDPTRMEHFGIATVEAMSAGVIPVVYDAGGQKEIIQDGETGFLWKRESELIASTQKIMTDSHADAIRLSAIKRAAEFTPVKFEQNFDALLAKLFL